MTDIIIAGAGILGTSVAYWIKQLFPNLTVMVLEKEMMPAFRASGRNTGVVHRPFYLHPERKKIFARSAQLSYAFWKEYALRNRLPWNQVGTLEVATKSEDCPHLEEYARWAVQNGMNSEEIDILDKKQVATLEPNVRSEGAILSKTDTSVDYGLFTESLADDARKHGVVFKYRSGITNAESVSDGVELQTEQGERMKARYLINCAGGNAIALARKFNLATEYGNLSVRGEYWMVHPAHRYLAKRNIYSVPRHSAFPFLDPHWIVRWDGRVEIGPNAVPLFELNGSPLMPLVRLAGNKEFLTLAMQEWKSSFSKHAMAKRINLFMPKFKTTYLSGRGTAGVRTVIVDKEGHMIPEAIPIFDANSLHVLNYNSPGATGAPAYAAYLVLQLMTRGVLPSKFVANSRMTDPLCFERMQEGFKA